MIEKYLNKITHGDCLDIMRELPDKCIELILTDPPLWRKDVKAWNDWQFE